MWLYVGSVSLQGPSFSASIFSWLQSLHRPPGPAPVRKQWTRALLEKGGVSPAALSGRSVPGLSEALHIHCAHLSAGMCHCSSWQTPSHTPGYLPRSPGGVVKSRRRSQETSGHPCRLCQNASVWPGASRLPLVEGVSLPVGWEEPGRTGRRARLRAETPTEPSRLSLQALDVGAPHVLPWCTGAGKVDSGGNILVATSRSQSGEF